VLTLLSSGSSGAVVVTAPFSVMPQPDSTAAPSRSRAERTSARGIGAPADRKTRNDWRFQRPLAASSVRSLRNGVEAMV
jgi:hypothetical protein